MASSSYRLVDSKSEYTQPASASRQSLDDVVAPGSPYMTMLSSSFSSNDRDFSLDDRYRPVPTNSYSQQDSDQQQSQVSSPRLRSKINSLINPFKSTSSMSSESASPTVSHRGPFEASGSSASVLQNPFDSSRSSSPEPSLSSPSLQKAAFKNNSAQRPSNSYSTQSGPSYQQQYQQQQQYMQPQQQQPQNRYAPMQPSPLQPPASIPTLQQQQQQQYQGGAYSTISYHSYDQSGMTEGSTNSSTHRSSRNLGVAADPRYNVTQSDSTLEGLTERWNAYQAMMRKYYAEVPFYRRWTKSKWMLVLTVTMLWVYSIGGLYLSLIYLTKRAEYSAIVLEFHSNLVYLCLAGSIVGIIAGIFVVIGIWKENRVYLSIYNLLLWVVFVLYTAVGYVAFLRAKNYLRENVNKEWLFYTRQQKLLIQRELKCCGYNSWKQAAAYDLRCFPGTVLPRCAHKYNTFERTTLKDAWTASFALVPIELFVMLTALLCSNHVDGMYRSARPGLVSFKEEKEKKYQ